MGGGRLQYLQAMGIPVWVRRHPTRELPAVAAVEEVGRVVEEVPSPFAGEEEHARLLSLPATTPTDAVGAQPDITAFRPAVPEPQTMGRAEEIAQLDWDALRARVAQCNACDLHQWRTQTVFGVGNERAEWMIIGEAPGADEDRKGEPFVGRAGQLLNAMLAAIGLKREEVYIANVLKSRPPNNRDPRPEEVAACEPYLHRQIALIKPRIILVVGRIAAQSLLKTDQTIGKLRGYKHLYPQGDIPLVVTYHPAYLLRNPSGKRGAWEDLKFARKVLAESA